MRKYEEYKDSGIDWIGDTPKSWTIKRVKDVFNQISLTGSELENKTYIPLENIESFTGRLLKRISNENNESTNLFKSGDILLNKLRPYLGKVYLPDFDGGVSGEVVVLRNNTFLKKQIFPEYFFYRFLSTKFIFKINSLTDGVKMPRTNPTKILRLEIPVPPLQEQQAIANYLDAKTQAIDKKISLLEQKIETYKKLKRTLINQTITKGLDKNAPLKDSGISWIGQIPQHWEVKRLKDVCKSMSSGATPTSGNLSYYEDGTINWLNTGDLNDGIINSTQKKLNKTVFDDYPNLKIQKKGTLVIAMYGATIGKMGLLDIDSTTNQACCCLNLKNDNFNKFHFYQLLNIKQYIISLSVGGTQPNVSQGILSFIEIVVPPKSEQEEIAKYLDHKTATIDAIVGNISKQIETLKQLRKTLINDVVTGKIKVVDI